MKFIVAYLCLLPFLLVQPASTHIKSALAAYQAGEIAARNKQFQDAIDQFHKSIQIEPTFRSAFDSLIAACLSSGRRSEAAAVITQLLEIEPELTRYRLLLGQILIEEEQPGRALAQFSFVIRSDGLNANALLGFADAAKRMGLNDRAAEALDRGRKQYPLDDRFKQGKR